MRTLTLLLATAAAVVLNTTATDAQQTGRDVTCRGVVVETDPESGDTAAVGKCGFIKDERETGGKILAVCRIGRKCEVKARLDGIVVEVYSVRRLP